MGKNWLVTLRQDLYYFWRISRPGNVLISCIAFTVGCFLTTDESWHFVEDALFWATMLTICIIAASGYWINDVYDFRIDRINKPGRAIINAHISVKKAITAYGIATLSILAFSGWFIGLRHQQYEIVFINLLSVILLFVYASYLKRVSVAGNLLISFLIALVLLLAGYLYKINFSLMWAIVFAFEITLIREITKDVEDIKGDLHFNLRTLPIQLGIRHTKQILSLLYALFLLSCYGPFFFQLYRNGEANWLYLWSSMALVQLPSIFLLSLLSQASHPRDFTSQSRYLKYLMLSGILTLFML